jgi:hypothetical protein
MFEVVGRYANNAVPPGVPVLTTDEQFNFLAARPPSRSATGYLVDSYGHMIYLGLELDRRDLGDLWGDLFGGRRSDDAYAAMLMPAPQADMLDRASRAALVVIHDKGFARLAEETVTQIRASLDEEVAERRYSILRAR